LTGDGISVSTLSVDTSTSGSFSSTRSPSFFSQRVTVPSVTLSPRAGILTGSGIVGFSFVAWQRGSVVNVQRLTGQGEVRLADRLALGRVHVDELSHIGGERLPVVDELSLADQLAHPAADHVQPDHRAVGQPYQFDHALRLEDVALEVATEVVDVGLDLVGAVPLAGTQLGEADRRDLRVAVGHPRD